MKITLSKSFVLLLPALLLSSCATIAGGGTTQVIHVQALNSTNNQVIPDTACSITDGKGIVYALNTNPGTVTVTRGHGALQITCQKSGFKESKVASGDSFNAWTLGDILFWPGAIVDVVNGSAEKYPSHLTVLMDPIQK